MAQDSDVARVAAALKAPGMRYKSFGNDPFRGAVQPVENVANSFPSLETVTDGATAAPEPAVAAAPQGAPEPAPRHHEPPPASFTPPPAGFAAPASGFTASPPPAEESAGAAAGPFPFGVPPAYPEPVAPFSARKEWPGFGAAMPPQGRPPHPPSGQAPTSAQAPADHGFGGPTADPVENTYRLLEALSRQADPPRRAPQPPPYPSQAPAGTFGSLPGAETSGPVQSFGQATLPHFATHHVGYGQSGPGPKDFGPPAQPTGNWTSPVPSSALLPAAMVTLPLAEVMRLVAVGAPLVSSPFAAFRVSGGAPDAR